MRSETNRVVTICLLTLILFTLLLSGCIGDPNAQIDSELRSLIEADKQGKAEEYALAHGLVLRENGVMVIIKSEPGKFKEALEVTWRYGTATASSAKGNEIEAFVPIGNLIPLVKEPSIQSIGLPPHIVH